MAGKEEDPKESSCAAGYGGSTPAEEAAAEYAGKDDPTENSQTAGRGGMQGEKVEAAAAADPEAAAAAAAGVGSEEELSEEELVEMPEDYLRWLLAQTRETDPVPKLSDYNTKDPQVLKHLQEDIDFLQAAQDDFFEYQASVREKLKNDGRVMIPAAAVGPTDQFQEAIDEYWYGLLKEYDGADSEFDVAEPFN